MKIEIEEDVRRAGWWAVGLLANGHIQAFATTPEKAVGELLEWLRTRGHSK